MKNIIEKAEEALSEVRELDSFIRSVVKSEMKTQVDIIDNNIMDNLNEYKKNIRIDMKSTEQRSLEYERHALAVEEYLAKMNMLLETKL